MCKRGEVYMADLSPVIGSEQGGYRPVVIIQNDLGNKHSHTVIVCPITSKVDYTNMPTHVVCGIYRKSVILAEQLKTLDKSRLTKRIGILKDEVMAAVDKALKISLNLK